LLLVQKATVFKILCDCLIVLGNLLVNDLDVLEYDLVFGLKSVYFG